MAQTTKRLRGATFVDTLIGTLIVIVAVIGVVNLFGLLTNVTRKNQQITVAYAVARTSFEKVRGQGFPKYPEGTTTSYYDAYGNSLSSSTGARYSAVTTVTSSAFATGTTSKPAPTAIRTVTVQVNTYPANGKLLRWGTYLVRGGI